MSLILRTATFYVQKMSDEGLVKRVAKYCWSNKFLDVFQKYFTDNAYLFEDAPPMTGGEHNMEYYTLFQDYLKVYEVCI